MADVADKCKHQNFEANCEMARIEDIGRFVLHVRVRCSACGVPMRFLGLPLGLDYNSATVRFDGTEARLAVYPAGETVPPIHGVEGYSIRKEQARGDK